MLTFIKENIRIIGLGAVIGILCLLGYGQVFKAPIIEEIKDEIGIELPIDSLDVDSIKADIDTIKLEDALELINVEKIN